MIGIKNMVSNSKDITKKAYLKNSDGFCFPLSTKQISIGREGCDILIQVPTVDHQHAMVEFNEIEECFVLTDLNTINGTFVNDVRVHNASVRLAPRDIIRFGSKGTPYEFYICNYTQMSSSRASPFQRSTWGQQIKLSNNQQSLNPTFSISTLPQLSSTPFHSTQDQPSSITAWAPAVTSPAFTSYVSSNGGSGISVAANGNSPNVTALAQSPIPQPPDQVRPTINGYPQRLNWERAPPVQKVYADSPPVSQINSWDSNFFIPSKVRSGNGNSHTLNASYTILPAEDTILDDKDKKIASLTSEVNRLKSLEEELLQEQELRNQIEEKLKQVKSEFVPGLPNEQLKEEIKDKTNQLISLQSELDKVKKDKNITVGLVTQMQKDLSCKDTTISKLTREVETLKRNIWDQETSMETMTSKISKMKDGLKRFEANESREKELHNIHQKLKVAEAKQKHQEDFIASQAEEIHKLKQMLSDEAEEKKKMQADLGQVRFELDDITRAERMVRVDMEQATKQMERFHNRVLQVAFSIPGKGLPKKEMNEDDLIEILKTMAQAQNTVSERIKNMERRVKEAQQEKEELIEMLNQLNPQILQLLMRLESSGLRSANLKKEMELLESIGVEEPFTWVKNHFMKLLKTEINWQCKIEASLEKCGINMKVSTSEPGQHINWLQNKWSVALEENEQLKKRIAKSDENHMNELQVALETKEKETVERIKEAVEKAMLQGKENLVNAVEEMQNLEVEKQAAAVKKEKEKIEELSVTVNKLKKLINEKDKETQDKLEEANKVLTEMEELKIHNSQLEERLLATRDELGLQAEKNKIELQTDKNKREKEILTYKEQIKQHSITICTLEEKLAKMTKAHKKSVDEVATLEEKLHENRTQLPVKRSPPPKPKVIVQKPPPDLLARDQLITVLRKEALELKQQLQDKEEVIIGLRKDLLGTSARLSDIKVSPEEINLKKKRIDIRHLTGELCEESKKKLERSKHSINMHQQEMNDLRQKLAVLSQVIEEKKEHIKRLQTDLEREKGTTRSFKQNNNDLSEKITLLERFMDQEKAERYKIDNFNERENQYASELADLGAQCRGERHHQVIDRQREALAELRKKLKILEQNKFHSGSNSLKYQIKGTSDLNDFYHTGNNKNNSANLSLPINQPKSLGSSLEFEMERSAHKETAEALEASEISYLYMLRQLLGSLQVEDSTGLRSLVYIAPTERQQVLESRKQTCEKLIKEIKIQQDRLNQKEQLLKDYEDDLAKMRTAEDLASRKTTETDLLAKDLINKTEESELLRESLNRTMSQLQQEQRLNNAIKQKKTFHLENERAHIGAQSSPHQCSQDKSTPKIGIGQKNMSRGLVSSKDSQIKSSRKEMIKNVRMDKKLCQSDIGTFLSTRKHHQPEKT